MQTSIWEKETFYAPRDIVILGSGFAGLWSAYFLKKGNPKLSIAIVDRGIIPTGASTRNAGFACFGSITELIFDAQKMGEDKMVELVRMRYTGLEKIKKVFRKKEIDFSDSGGYEMISARNGTNGKSLAEEVAWINDKLAKVTKTKKSFAFADEKIRKFGLHHVSHLVENTLEGYLHPGKLCMALLSQVQSMGVAVLNNIEVTSYVESNSGVDLQTDIGVDLRAKQLLICTNAFTELLPELEVVPARGQVLVTAPIPGLKIKGAFHFDEGFFYFRNLGDRLLLGGARNKAFEEERTKDMQTSDKIQQELESFLKHYLLPDTPFRITDRWSGIMGTGAEKMPIVKNVSGNVFCAVRMSGIGVALTPVIGEKIAAMMLN